jgi:hypothetical protein
LFGRKSWNTPKKKRPVFTVGRRRTGYAWIAVDDGRAPVRRDAEHGIDVQRDRPEPSQFRLAMPVLIQPPHVAAILGDDVIERILISGRRQAGPTQGQHGGRDSAPPRRRLFTASERLPNPPGQGFFVVAKQPVKRGQPPLQPEPLVPRHHRFDRRPRRGEVPGAPARKAPPEPLHRCEVKAGSGAGPCRSSGRGTDCYTSTASARLASWS